MWHELQKTALLGTERTHLTPETLAQAAAWGIASEGATPAETLLALAATVERLERTAQPLRRFAGTRISPALPETLQAADAPSTEYVALLHILAAKYTDIDFTAPFLSLFDALERKGMAIPTTAVLPLEKALAPYPLLYPRLTRVLSNRTRAALTQLPQRLVWHEDWAAAAWQHGTTAQRVTALIAHRLHDAAAALEALVATFPNEKADDAAALLGVLRYATIEPDRVFLAAAAADKRKTVAYAATVLLAYLDAVALTDTIDVAAVRQRVTALSRTNASAWGELQNLLTDAGTAMRVWNNATARTVFEYAHRISQVSQPTAFGSGGASTLSKVLLVIACFAPPQAALEVWFDNDWTDDFHTTVEHRATLERTLKILRLRNKIES